MKFKGTIVITDPCYIIREPNEEQPNFSTWPGLEEVSPSTPFSKYNESQLEAYDKYRKALKEFRDKYDDWDKCDYGDSMENLGFSQFISEPTIYGDWSCTTWCTPREDIEAQIRELNNLCNDALEAENNYGKDSVQSETCNNKRSNAIDNIKDLGVFCADAGMVAVFLLDEVLKYNPDFSKWIEERPWCATIIPDFDGDVQYYVDEDTDAHIIGRGNINFFTTQSGF